MQYVLSHCDGSESIAELAAALLQHFNDSFSSREEALRFIKNHVDKFG